MTKACTRGKLGFREDSNGGSGCGQREFSGGGEVSWTWKDQQDLPGREGDKQEEQGSENS